MANKIKYIINRPILLLIFILVVIVVPVANTKPPQSATHTFVRTIGIDKVADDYEVSMITFTPASTQSFAESYMLTTAKGKSVTQALDTAGDYLGKQIALAHLDNIIIGNSAAENLMESINLLARQHVVNNSTNIICTNIDAKKFLEETLTLEGQSSSNESSIVEHNTDFVNGFDSNIETVLQSAYAPHRTTLISVLKLSDEGVDLSGESQTNSSGAESSSGGGSQSSSQGGEEKKKMENDGSVAVVIKGKKVGELTGDDTKNLSYINNKSNWGKILLDNYSDENLQEANVVLNCIDNKVKKKVHFDENVPVLQLDIDLKLEILEINQKENTGNLYQPKNMFLNEKMKKTIKEKIKTDFYTSYEKLKALNADPYKFYEIFDKNEHNKFKNFLQSLDNPELYLEKIKVVLNVNCSSVWWIINKKIRKILKKGGFLWQKVKKLK